MSPILFEAGTTQFDTLGLGVLSDVTSALVTEELNGEFTLTMEYKVGGKLSTEIKQNRILVVSSSPTAQRQAFMIRKITKPIKGKFTVYAEHVSYLSYDMTLRPIQSVTGDAGQALTTWKGMLTSTTAFTVWSDITTTNQTSFGMPEFENARQALGGHAGSILDVWGGEYEFDNYAIRLHKQRGHAANTIVAYGRNLTDFTQEESILDTWTSIYPYVTLMNDGESNESTTYYLDELVVDGEHVNDYPNRRAKPVDFSQEFKDASEFTQDKLRSLANSYMHNNNFGVPSVSITLSALDLAKAAGYDTVNGGDPETINLADTVNVYFDKIGVRTSAQVTRVVWNVLKESYDSYDLGAKKASLADSIKDQVNTAVDNSNKALTDTIQTIVSSDGRHNTSFGDSSQGMPLNPKEGDIYFMEDGDDSYLYVAEVGEDGTVSWVLKTSTKSGEYINSAVDSAVSEAQEYADSLSATQSEATSSVAHKLSEAAEELTRNQQNIASQASAYTDSAVAEANAKAVQIGQTTAQNAQKALEEKSTTLQQSIDNKVAKTDYDKKTGELKTSVNTAQQTADTATQTIGTYKESNDKRVSAAETNIKANSDAIKLTVSKTDFDKATGKLSGDISSLEQRADGFEATVTKVNNLAVGSRNLLLDTGKSFTGVGAGNTNGNFNAQSGMYYLSGGKKVSDLYNQYGSSWYLTLSFDWVASGSTISGQFNPQWNAYPWDKGISNVVNLSATNASGHYEATIPLKTDGYSNGWATGIMFRQDNLQGNITISNLKLEAGNVATDWTPAPEDINTQLAQVKITADGVYQTVNDPKTGLNTRVSTAEGNITKVQNSVGSMSNTVTETADGLTREIADRKTGDTNTLQAGKDFTTSQITSYDTGMQSRLSQTSDAILAKVGATNLFPNSEFNANYGYRQKDGNTTLSLATKNNIDGAYNGTVSVSSTSPSYQGYWANNIPVQGGQKYSASVKVHYTNGGSANGSAVLDLWFVDSKGARISSASADTSQVSSPYWVRLVSEGFTAPTNAVYLQMSLLVNNAGAGQVATFTQPMLTATEKLQQYTPNNDVSAQLSLFKDNWSIGINDNAGALISGINGDKSGMTIAAKKLTVSGDTTFLGNNWLNGAIIKNASIGGAQIAKASITDANILNLDVNKISGEVANFIRAYWDGQYGSTSITSEGMTVSAGVTTTVFDENGMQLNKSNRSVGRIGVNDLYQDNSKKGLYFGLESTGDFMAWGAQNYAGNPYDTKLSWYRVGSVPSNLPGTIEGFNFQDNVLFNRPLEMRGGIKIQGTDDKLVAKTTTFNGFNYPTFGTSSAGLAYGSVETYLISNGTAYNLSKIIKALSGISSAAIPSGFTSDGKATGWYNINFK